MMTRRLLLQCLGTALALAGFGTRAFAIDFPEWYTLANAAAQNKTEDVAGMLRRGDNPNFTDSAGRTPLDYARGVGVRGRAGGGVAVRDSTVALLSKLLADQGKPVAESPKAN